MTARQRLEQYLTGLRQRIRTHIYVRAAAAVAVDFTTGSDSPVSSDSSTSRACASTRRMSAGIRLPDSMNPSLGGRKARFEPSVIDGTLGRVATPPPRPAPQMPGMSDAGRPVAIPVMGRIAAGTPIEAIQSHSHTIAVPPEMLGGGEHYALEVRGDSMIDAGIFDGDTVIIKKQDTAATGEIIVALVDEEEATLNALSEREWHALPAGCRGRD